MIFPPSSSKNLPGTRCMGWPSLKMSRWLRAAAGSQEAQLASSLHHPNIVTIFDIGSANETEYLALELVRGRTLDTHQIGLERHRPSAVNNFR